jgi:hypothetical protein
LEQDLKAYFVMFKAIGAKLLEVMRFVAHFQKKTFFTAHLLANGFAIDEVHLIDHLQIATLRCFHQRHCRCYIGLKHVVKMLVCRDFHLRYNRFDQIYQRLFVAFGLLEFTELDCLLQDQILGHQLHQEFQELYLIFKIYELNV